MITDDEGNTYNWGNLMIIYDLRGFYVEISHFVQNSIKVKEGDWVEKGALIKGRAQKVHGGNLVFLRALNDNSFVRFI